MLHLRPGMNRWPQTLAWSLALIAATGCHGGSVRETRSSIRNQKSRRVHENPVTFNRDIAPIIFNSCSTCHHPGEAATFPAADLSDVKKHAHQIADVTRRATCLHGCRIRSL